MLPSCGALVLTPNAKSIANMTYSDTLSRAIGREFDFERAAFVLLISLVQGIPRYSWAG